MRTFFLLFFFFGWIGWAFAQPGNYNLSDSLRESFAQTPKLTGNITTRNAFITGRPIRTYGIKGGLSFGRRVNLGLAYHWMRHGDTYDFVFDNGFEESRELRLHYLAAYFEYSAIARKNWEVTFPFVVGYGRSREFRANELPRDAFNHGSIVLYETGVLIDYHFLRYFAVGGGGGIRIMLKNNRLIDQQFTAPIWEMRLRVKLGVLYSDLKPRIEPYLAD